MTTEQLDHPACEHCRHFQRSSVNRGKCRANPPSIQADGKTRFPRVWLTDWCANFKPILEANNGD